MREVLYGLLVAVAIFASTPAQALNDSRAFPPDNCSAGSPFMGFTGIEGSNTFCNSGQDIFKSAIPTCTAGQIVAYDGSKFICKAETTAPTCAAGSFLTFDGTSYQCVGTGVATCGDNQVLTFNGSSYFCVNKDASIPVCGPNQFLTYNGAYQCAAVNSPSIPNCPAGSFVTGNGSSLSCASSPVTALPNCAAGEVLTSRNGQMGCVPGSTGPGNSNGTCKLESYNVADGGHLKGHRQSNGSLVDDDANYLAMFTGAMTPVLASSTSVPTAYAEYYVTGDCSHYGSTLNGGTCYVCGGDGNWRPFMGVQQPTNDSPGGGG